MRKVARLVTPVLAIAAVGASSWMKIHDPDVFWHVATGGVMASQGAVPRVDRFSYASPGPVKYVEVLADLAFWACQRALGWTGVQAFVVVLAASLAMVSAAYVVATRGKPALSLALVVALVGAASHFRFGPKTDQFTFLGVGVALALLAQADRTGRARPLLWLPPLSLVWTGLHRGGTLAPALAGVALVAWVVGRERPGLLWRATLAIAAALGALAVGFGGLGYLTASFDLGSRASFESNLPEWAPPPFQFFWAEDPAYLVLLLLGAAGLLRRPRPFTAMAALALVALATKAVRFVPLAAIGVAPLAAEALDWAIEVASARLRGVGPRAATCLLACACLGISAAQYSHGVASSMIGTGLLDWRVPVDAAEWLRTRLPPGLMWNSYNFGGYLVFALWPSERVLIDGRNDTVYPDALFDEVARASADPRPFDEHLARWPVGFAVVQVPGLQDTRFAWLQRRTDWQMVYLDDIAAVFVRRTPESEAYLREHGYRELRIESALARAARPEGDPAREQFELEAARLLATSPRSIRAHYLAALVHRSAGRLSDYAREREEVAALLASRDLTLALP